MDTPTGTPTATWRDARLAVLAGAQAHTPQTSPPGIAPRTAVLVFIVG